MDKTSLLNLNLNYEKLQLNIIQIPCQTFKTSQKKGPIKKRGPLKFHEASPERVKPHYLT